MEAALGDPHAKQHSQAERKDHSEELKARNAASLPAAAALPKRYPGLRLFRGCVSAAGADCVVNAANEGLCGGGGVDGVLHALAAGSGSSHDTQACPLCAEVRARFPADPSGARLRTGQAATTRAYNVPGARFIVHTVGPYLDEAGQPQPALLRACYTSSLREAQRAGATSIAFPAISTGYYGYPMLEAGRVAVAAVTDFFDSAECQGAAGGGSAYAVPVLLAAFDALSAEILGGLLGGGGSASSSAERDT